ncbi:uncharacterized protein LOC136714006 [Amia ocellicauda]|uniref:uncharacterized protein LOC136714006 n=1 Tax=Amia ocellicauda TaxID=2972642 RepID=UPI0034640D4B
MDVDMDDAAAAAAAADAAAATTTTTTTTTTAATVVAAIAAVDDTAAAVVAAAVQANTKNDKLSCRICHVSYKTSQALQEHFKGPKHYKKKQQLREPVFSGPGIHMKSLEKVLKSCTEPIVGLQYVWEFRSPSRSVPPHYQCKLCKVQLLQNEMVMHIKGWKHCYRLLKKIYPKLLTVKEEDAVKDPAVRKVVKDIAGQVEKASGRGNIRVLMKEPIDVPSFQGMVVAMKPKMSRQGAQNQGGRYQGGYPNHMYPADPGFPEFPMGMRNDDMSMRMRMRNDDLPMHMRPEDLSMSRYPEDMARGMYEDLAPQRPLSPGHGRRYPDAYPGGRRSNEREERGRREMVDFDGRPSNPMRRDYDSYRVRGPEGGAMDLSQKDGLLPRPLEKSVPATLFECLENFRIESESDAQIVLKVTQKLTDVLMEYRLRTMSGMSNSKLTSSPDKFSSSRLSGGDRYPDSSRYYD